MREMMRSPEKNAESQEMLRNIKFSLGYYTKKEKLEKSNYANLSPNYSVLVL